jgi:hypothetical protein
MARSSQGSGGDWGRDAYEVANTAMVRFEQHEILCGERYQQIVMNQNLSAQDRDKMRELISQRFKDLYGFMWAIAIAIIGTLVTVCGGLFWFLLTNSFVFKQP